MKVAEKRKILDAWIAMEQFSEGDIDLKEGGNVKYKQLPSFCDNWTKFFMNKVNEFKIYKKLTKKKLNNIGFSIFFDIFPFEELINGLSQKFDLPEEFRDDSHSKKFTYCLSFEIDGSGFKLHEGSLFYTMSGYAHRYKDFPEQISLVESDLSKKIAEFFEYDFEKGMAELITLETKWSKRNYYEIQEDITKTDPRLHSFYINDLVLAKEKDTPNLNRYLFGFSGQRVNLDSNKENPTFNAKDIAKILEPKNYPLGRFPSDPRWGLSLMQQVAVNMTLNNKNNIRGVNGPPGTGKTTLLKDIFAELIVRQAHEICNLNEKHLNETNIYYKNGKIAELPNVLAEKNILVASSNNGAVQNIVNELPQQKEIDKHFLEDILDADYFVNVSNDEDENENWGMFATESGKSDNRKKMIEMMKQMVKELNSDTFVSDGDAYKKFREQHNHVKKMRRDAQKIADTYKKFIALKDKLDAETKKFQHELAQKKVEREQRISQEEKRIEELDPLIAAHHNKSVSIEENKVSNERQLELSKVNMNAVKQQKPVPFFFLKLIHHKSAKEYTKQLSTLSISLTRLLEEQNSLKKALSDELECLSKLKNERRAHVDEKESIDVNFKSWHHGSKERLDTLASQVQSLETKIKESRHKPIDLTQSYDELQQANPWFDEEYRIEQSKLFIAALAVRKQFLYENRRSLNGSSLIWERMSDYTIPQKYPLILMAWNWINFAIPVISTTFASFGGMFKYMGVGSVANLFIDEAGQATPQSAVGAILRSKRIIAVGDPSQIPPVIPLSNGVIGLIAANYQALESIVNGYTSVQTLVDEASQYGYQKTGDEWIGIPLWVHRRCLDPMFSISNQISYQGQMVLPDSMSQPGGGAWIDIKGKSNNKFVKAQADWVKAEIEKYLEKKPESRPSIYVISPFKNVVNQLKVTLKQSGFALSNIGTVHTFQGKEADIVYLVLGASPEEIGAARWAVTQPNLMNVAATRAKKEFYIIGDKELYRSLKSEVVNTTLDILNETHYL